MAGIVNSGGDPIFFAAQINDNTGVTVTVAAAATPQAILDSGSMLAAAANLSGGALTYSAATGVLTCANQIAFGNYLVEACGGNTIGVNAKYHELEIWASEAGAAKAIKGVASRKLEPATAAQSQAGSAIAVVTLSAVGDTIEPRVRVETDGNAVVFRDFLFKVTKIGEV